MATLHQFYRQLQFKLANIRKQGRNRNKGTRTDDL